MIFMISYMCSYKKKGVVGMYLSMIQKSIDYIEDNLKTDITAKELSEMAGFSMFHFYRLFQSAVGMPVMQYITRRRLLHALYDMHCGVILSILLYTFFSRMFDLCSIL